ncbi:hypothetical protein PVAND_017557 [Polypedilum vanderplanki]|uniref:Zinc finger protein n=1 Tax=Polypedilum vanderplanki TaxID=319348 RepID=A0A9J6BIY6_POLVA|nr:hypothetical protein PVAND_017557 [Polypedilum vanderplanki]
MEERICRICLTVETNKEFRKIFDSNLGLKIFLISNVKIVEVLNIPALICKSCEIELYQCINFRKKIQISQEYFNNQLYEHEFNLWNESQINEESKEQIEKEEIQDLELDRTVEEYQIEKLTFHESQNEDHSKIEEEISFIEKKKKKTIVRRPNRTDLTCQYCGLKLSRRQRLMQHERLHLIEATKSFYTCDMCNKQMSQRFALVPHFQKHHNFKIGPKERWKCAICENKTLPACKMEVHYRNFHSEFYTNDEDKTDQSIEVKTLNQKQRSTKFKTLSKKVKQTKIFFPCSLCGNSFTNSYRYHKHLNDIHGVKEQEILQNAETIEILLSESLDISQKSLKDNQELKKSKNVPCSTCGKVFSSITTCKAHEKTHLDTKYYCDLCGSSFKVKAYLTSHVQKVHLKLKRFKCSMCEEAFIHRELLNYHVKKHLNIRNFSCQFCQKTFVRKSCAIIHERIHKNERPYSCAYCNKTFIHNSDHRRHEIRHLNNMSHLNSRIK